MQKILGEKKTEKTNNKESKVEKIVNKKVAVSKDGIVHMNDTNMKNIIKAMRENAAQQFNHTANTILNLKI